MPALTGPITALRAMRMMALAIRSWAGIPIRLLRIYAFSEVAHVDSKSEVPQVVFADTIREPNMIGVDASEQRMEAAADAGVLEAALDAAESARAGNSLEKMLSHQMAAAHHAAMKLMARGTDSRLSPVEMTRLTNAAARMMDTYQTAFLTLLKIRTGGKQTVVVQHVQVSDGGQALITGSVKAGGLKPGEVTGNDQ